MDKSAASRLMPGSPVMFRGRRHFVVSARRGPQSDAPLFRLRDLDDARVVTDLVSYKMLEPVLKESAVKAEEPMFARGHLSLPLGLVESLEAPFCRSDHRVSLITLNGLEWPNLDPLTSTLWGIIAAYLGLTVLAFVWWPL
jgi:hypothetical protein